MIKYSSVVRSIVPVAAAEITIKRSIVRDTAPSETDGELGVGVAAVFSYDEMKPSTVSIQDSIIANNHLMGIGVVDSNAEVRGCVVRDTKPQMSDGMGGVGILIGSDKRESSIQIENTRVMGSYGAGISINNSISDISGVMVEGTLPEESSGEYGDGILVQRSDGYFTRLNISNSLISRSARVGLLYIAAAGEVKGNVFRKNKFPIALGNGSSTETEDDNLKVLILDDNVFVDNEVNEVKSNF